MRMTPEQLAKSGSEHAHQRAFFQWLMTWNRDVHKMTFAIPNGGARGNDQKTSAIRGNMLKVEGVKRGIPDIMCAWPLQARSGMFYCGLFVELKKMKGGVVADAQSDYKFLLTARGYKVVTCFNWQEVANAFAGYFGQEQPYPAASGGLE